MGIGGSERLVTDAAVALTRRGERVTLYVPDRAGVVQFPQLADFNVLFERHGAWLPAQVAGRLRLPMAIVRTAHAAWHMTRGASVPDVVFVDVIPHVIPFLRRFSQAPVLYFCHFPDLLLTAAGSRTHPTYRAYRRPLDGFEEKGMASADVIVANSHFTAGVIRETFASVPHDRLTVLYPGVPVPDSMPAWSGSGDDIVLLSVNRFDPRKNLGLAIEALGSLRDRLSAETFARVKLVLAGHYDPTLPENVALLEGLQRRVIELGLSSHVEFAISPSEASRTALLERCRCVIYTPTAEHFGYGPVEAMAAGRPVVAVNHGGPVETVQDGQTGFLCDATPEAFAACLSTVVENDTVAASMGRAGHTHTAQHFSLRVFGDRLHAIVTTLADRPRTDRLR